MSLTKKTSKNRSSANNSHGDVDAGAADADAGLELVDAAAVVAADAGLELVDAVAAGAGLELVDAAAADRLPLAADLMRVGTENSLMADRSGIELHRMNVSSPVRR